MKQLAKDQQASWRHGPSQQDDDMMLQPRQQATCTWYLATSTTAVNTWLGKRCVQDGTLKGHQQLARSQKEGAASRLSHNKASIQDGNVSLVTLCPEIPGAG
jgi:hypothetical protein